MNRKIKFRSYDRVLKRWAYLELIGQKFVFDAPTIQPGEQFSTGNLGEWQEYIGKEDVTGQEIYEGDLVCILNPENYYRRNEEGDFERIEDKGTTYRIYPKYAIEIKWSKPDMKFVLGERRKRSEEHGTFGQNGGRLSLRGKKYKIVGNNQETGEEKCRKGCPLHKYHCGKCYKPLTFSPANYASRPHDIPNPCKRCFPPQQGVQL